MKKISSKLILLGAGLLIFVSAVAVNRHPPIYFLSAIHSYSATFLPLPALVIFLVGWIMSFFEKDK